MEVKQVPGIFAIIIGFILLISPLLGLFTVGAISGVILLLVGMWIVYMGYTENSHHNDYGIVILVLGIIGMIVGLYLLANLNIINRLGIWTYVITGIFLILNSVLTYKWIDKTDNHFVTEVSAYGLLLGILFIFVGTFAIDPKFIGVLLGLGVILYGLLFLRK